MKWKQLIEDKVKQDVFIESFESDDSKVMEHIYKYFENFFDVAESSDYISLDKSDNVITFKVYRHLIEVRSGNTPSIKFNYYSFEEGNLLLLGQLYVPEMRFTHSGGTKVELFSDDLLNRLLEKAFSGVVSKPSIVVPKPF